MKYAQIFALGIILTLAITTLTGCASIKEKLGELWQKNKPQIELPTPEQPPEQTTDDEVDFSKLQWTRGGENFAGAVRDSRVTIRNVAVLEDALVALLGNPAAGQVTGQVAGQVEKK